MSRKFCLLFAILIISITGSLAQKSIESGDEVVVRYRDGSVFHGQFIEKSHGQVKLKLNTGDTIRLINHLVQRMDGTNHKIWFKGLRQHKKSGIYLLTSTDIGGDSQGQYMAHGSLQGGYRLSARNSVGAGVSISQGDMYIGGNWITISYIPIYAYGRHYFTDKRRRLYGFTKLGYGVHNPTAFGDEHSGGIFLQPGFGVHLATRLPFNWHFFLAQTIFHTSGSNRETDQFGFPIITEYNVWFNRLTFGFGIEIF
ncbi:MAG: hypothetical protein JXQ90_12295 [Cyclobacteriaceae bacterium]